jgi:hypothetical protein
VIDLDDFDVEHDLTTTGGQNIAAILTELRVARRVVAAAKEAIPEVEAVEIQIWNEWGSATDPGYGEVRPEFAALIVALAEYEALMALTVRRGE